MIIDHEKISKSIAQTIIEKRYHHHLTQAELAVKIGVSRQTVGKWENSKHSVPAEMIYHLAYVFGCPISDFYRLV